MKIARRSGAALGVMGLALMALLCQPAVTDPRSWAQHKAPERPKPQGPAEEIKAPRGTPDAITAIMTRQSIREYTPHPVSPDLINLLLKAAMSAPSAFNERSTEFVVVNDRKILDEIAKMNPKSQQMKKATVAIVVCGNQQWQKEKGQGYWQLDGAVASENILIAANALGLGAVWTAIYPYPDRIPLVQKILQLPEQVIPLNIIPVGYPAERKPREKHYDPSRLHTNRW